MKTIDCKQCRKRIVEETNRLNAENEYKIYEEITDCIAQATSAAMIAVMDRWGRSPQYVKKFYEEFLFVLNYPEVFGKAITSNGLMEQYKEKYGIDFSRIHIRIQAKDEFFHENKIRK